MNLVDNLCKRVAGDFSHRTQVGGAHSPSERRLMKKHPIRLIDVKGCLVTVEVIKTK